MKSESSLGGRLGGTKFVFAGKNFISPFEISTVKFLVIFVSYILTFGCACLWLLVFFGDVLGCLSAVLRVLFVAS